MSVDARIADGIYCDRTLVKQRVFARAVRSMGPYVHTTGTATLQFSILRDVKSAIDVGGTCPVVQCSWDCQVILEGFVEEIIEQISVVKCFRWILGVGETLSRGRRDYTVCKVRVCSRLILWIIFMETIGKLLRVLWSCL